MRSSSLTRIVTLTVIGLALPALPAIAGKFFFEQQCQIASTDPLRYRLRFWFWDERFYGPFCGAQLDPVSYNGSVVRPILDGTVPSSLQLSIDPSGSAHYTPAMCWPDQWLFRDSLSVVVDGLPAYFNASLISTNGAIVKTDLAQYLCSTIVGVDSDSPPKRLWLAAPSPNPGHDHSVTQFALPRATRLRLTVYDLTGRKRRTLIDGELPAGAYGVDWDFRDDDGRDSPSGFYVLRLEAEGTQLTRRILRLR